MAGKSKGRGVAAAVGWLLLCAGIVGAVALVVVGERRFENTVSTFARAQVGCATTLRFTDPGTFFVYEETGPSPVASTPVVDSDPADQCVPAEVAGTEFSFTLTTGDGVVRTVRDRSITYDQNGRTGESYSTFEVASPVTVDILVSGPDVNTVAAVGRNPQQARDDLRRTAVTLGIAGVVLGVLLLVLSGRRSRRAAAASVPAGPGWSRPIPPAPPVTWPPTGPSIAGAVPTTTQQPINPHMPDRPVGHVPPDQPWASPTQGLILPPAVDPLPRRMPPAPQLEPPKSTEGAATDQSVSTLPPVAPEIDSEAAHDGDDTTID